MTSHMELATFGGGCFWCLEAVFHKLRGVDRVVSGYMGGHTPNPDYDQVCSGRSGHAEVIQIQFDPASISYETLLQVFFSIHDPTTLNRQGADEGTQYRSIILTTSDAQRTAAKESLDAAQPAWGGRIITEVVPLEKFYPAESYHQDYYRKHPNEGYCKVVIKPKIDKLKKSPAVLGKK